jgi:hypothetical protein
VRYWRLAGTCDVENATLRGRTRLRLPRSCLKGAIPGAESRVGDPRSRIQVFTVHSCGVGTCLAHESHCFARWASSHQVSSHQVLVLVHSVAAPCHPRPAQYFTSVLTYPQLSNIHLAEENMSCCGWLVIEPNLHGIAEFNSVPAHLSVGCRNTRCSRNILSWTTCSHVQVLEPAGLSDDAAQLDFTITTLTTSRRGIFL